MCMCVRLLAPMMRPATCVRACARLYIYIGMHGSDTCMYLCTPLECICARVCYDSADAHTCGRVCVSTIRLCTACARVRRGRRHHVRACVCLPVYIANAHVMYIIYVYVYRCKVRVCKWVRMFVLEYARDRVRALTMREYAACVRMRRAHFVTPSMEHAQV